MSSARASPILPTETWIKLGIGPIEKRVHFDRRLGRTKIRPRKQRKAQIDRRAVERVHSVGESDPEVLRRIKFARAADQNGAEQSYRNEIETARLLAVFVADDGVCLPQAAGN